MIQATKKKRKRKATGTCYVDSAHAILMRPDEIAGWRDVRLVHGCPTATGGDAKGRKVGHAWIEGVVHLGPHAKVPMVYDAATGRTFVRAVYYAAGQILASECVSYTANEAREKMMAHGHYGPWHVELEGVL